MKHSVLIADDDADVVALLTQRCREFGWEVDSATNAMTALGKIEEDKPDVAILDVDMPYGNGLGVCEMMSCHEELHSIPVIMLTSSSREDIVRRCRQLSLNYVLKCPDLWSRIEPILREIMNEVKPTATGISKLTDAVFSILGAECGDSIVDSEEDSLPHCAHEPWVLSIEDDDDFALALRLRLEELGVKVLRAEEGAAGYRRAFFDVPKAIILDYELPQGNGDYVLRRLKESPSTCDIPVIVLTGRREGGIERQMRNLGASEFLTKPFDWKQLRAAIWKHIGDPIQAS